MFSGMGWITEKESEALKQALNRGQGDFTDQEFHQAVEWAKKVGLKEMALDLLFKGLAKVNVRNTGGEPVFSLDECDDALVGEPDQPRRGKETNARRLLRNAADGILN